MPTCIEIEISMNFPKPVGPCVEVWAVWGNVSTHTLPTGNCYAAGTVTFLPRDPWTAEELPVFWNRLASEISWSLDNGVKEIEDMSLLTSDNNFSINKAISLLYVLLLHLQKFRRMRFHLWLSGSSANPRDLNTLRAGQSDLAFGLWALTHKALRKFFWSFSPEGESSQDFLAELKGLLESQLKSAAHS